MLAQVGTGDLGRAYRLCKMPSLKGRDVSGKAHWLGTGHQKPQEGAEWRAVSGGAPGRFLGSFTLSIVQLGHTHVPGTAPFAYSPWGAGSTGSGPGLMWTCPGPCRPPGDCSSSPCLGVTCCRGLALPCVGLRFPMNEVSESLGSRSCGPRAHWLPCRVGQVPRFLQRAYRLPLCPLQLGVHFFVVEQMVPSGIMKMCWPCVQISAN